MVRIQHAQSQNLQSRNTATDAEHHNHQTMANISWSSAQLHASNNYFKGWLQFIRDASRLAVLCIISAWQELVATESVYEVYRQTEPESTKLEKCLSK